MKQESWTDGAGLSDEELKAKLARLEAAQARRNRQDTIVVSAIGASALLFALWQGLRDCGVTP